MIWQQNVGLPLSSFFWGKSDSVKLVSHILQSSRSYRFAIKQSKFIHELTRFTPLPIVNYRRNFHRVLLLHTRHVTDDSPLALTLLHEAAEVFLLCV